MRRNGGKSGIKKQGIKRENGEKSNKGKKEDSKEEKIILMNKKHKRVVGIRRGINRINR